MLKVTQPVSSRAWLDFSMSFPSTLGKNQLNFSSKEIKLERGKRKKESPWHTSFLLLALPLVANETVLPSRKTKPRKQRFFFFFFFVNLCSKFWRGGGGACGKEKGAEGPVSALFPHLLTGSSLPQFSVTALGTGLEPTLQVCNTGLATGALCGLRAVTPRL